MGTDDIRYPPGFGLRNLDGRGITGLDIHDDSSVTVIETRLDDNTSFQGSRSTSGSPDVGVTGFYATMIPHPGVRLEHALKHHLRTLNEEQQ